MQKAAANRPVVLLTGFGPFPGIDENASAALVRELARRARRALPEYRFAAAILPTEWARAPLMVQRLYAREEPVLALHFGVAGSARDLRLETEARNVCRPARDAVGHLPPAAKLSANGPDRIAVTIEPEKIAARLRANGHPVALSDDAGGYLCNAILYHSLGFAAAIEGRRCNVGFVHIPADLSRPPMAFAEAGSGALEIIKIALEPHARVASLTAD